MGPKDKPDHGTPFRCAFCYSSEENEEAYGKSLRKAGISVHYFCLLFSSDLWQRGKRDSDGILGFMPSDIRREQKRGISLFCRYCKEKGATIRCTVKTCEKKFHFRCGRDAGALCQFYDQFKAFCPSHRPHQTPSLLPKADESRESSVCCICMQTVLPEVSNDTLCAPCCGGSWFHRICIQRYAVTAGAYFFKCPLCNNKQQFEAEMLKFGIYIPEQDAAWEREPNAYHELLERYSNCDADKCLCPQGRRHVGEVGSQWELILCSLCGSSGTHVKCKGLKNTSKERLCPECAEITTKVKKKQLKACRKSGKMSGPRVADSMEEVQELLEDQRARLLRARRAARMQNNSTSVDEEMPGTSQHERESLYYDDSTESEDEECTPVASPSLFKDHKLIDSTPVVQIERANSDIDVNILDSEEEEEESTESESNDPSQPGCARLISLSFLKLARQPGRQSSTAGSWDVKGVIEKGQKKVVLLSMMSNSNKASSSIDSSVVSATSALQRQLSLQSTSTALDPKETPYSLETVGLGHQNQKSSRVQKSRPQKEFLDNQDSSSEEEEIGKLQNRLLISPKYRAAFRQRMIPAFRLREIQRAKPQEVYQVSDSSSEEDAGDRSLSRSPSRQPEESPAVQEFVSGDKEQAKQPSVPQKAVESAMLFEIKMPTEDPDSAFQASVETDPCRALNNNETRPESATEGLVSISLETDPWPALDNNETNPESATGGLVSASLLEDFSELDKEKRGSKPGILRKKRRPRKVRKSVSSGRMLLPSQVADDVSCMKTTTPCQQADRTGNMHSLLMAQTAAPTTSQQQNPAARAGSAEMQKRGYEEGNRAGQNAGGSTDPDGDLAMQQPDPSAFAQFQIPKPRNAVHTSAFPRPFYPPNLASTAAVAVRSQPGNRIPPRFLARFQGIQSQIRGHTSSKKYPRAPSGATFHPRPATAWQNVRHHVSAFQNIPVPSSPGTLGMPPSAFSQRNVGCPPASAFTLTNLSPLSVSSPRNVGPLSASASSTALPVTTGASASAQSTNPPYFITVPTTQSFQLGMITMQPQGPLPMPQNNSAVTPASLPYNMTMIGQPQPTSSASSAPAQFIPFMPQSSVPLLQWISLPQCFPDTSPPSGRLPELQAQSQRNPPLPQPTATVPAFQSRPAECLRVPCASQDNSGSALSTQPSNHASQRVPSPGHAESSDDCADDGDEDSQSITIFFSPTAQAKPASHRGGNSMNKPPSAAKSKPAEDKPVNQSSTQPLSSALSDQPPCSELRSLSLPKLPPVSQPSAETVGLGPSDKSTGEPDQRAPVPVALYSHTSVAPVMTCSKALADIATTVSPLSDKPLTDSQPPQPHDNASATRGMSKAAGLYCHPQVTKSPASTDQTSQPADRLAVPERNTSQSRPAASRVARVLPNTLTLHPARPPPPSASEQPALATTSGWEEERNALLSQQPQASESPVVVRENNQAINQETNLPVGSQAAPIHDQQVKASADTAAPPPLTSSDGDSSLAISRGKIWLGSESMPSQSIKSDVVSLTDSDDECDLEITGMTPGKTICKSKGRHCDHVGHSSAHKNTSSPQILGLLVPAPNKPPCPVHGHFRLVQHPRPSVPAKRNLDGSLSIDLTDESTGPKRPRIEGTVSLSDDDSDLEIIG